MSHAAPSIPDARSCGRDAAIARREAISRYGKKALSDPAYGKKAPSDPASSKKTASDAASEIASPDSAYERIAPSDGAKARLEAAKTLSALASGKKTTSDAASEKASPDSAYERKAPSDGAKARLEAAKLRMAARAETPLSCNENLKMTPTTPRSTTNCGCQQADAIAQVEYAAPSYTPEPISAARQRRIEQSLRGRGNAPPCRPCGRTPPTEPKKVGVGTTLAGGTVTGNQVDRTTQITGNEAGTCRTVTGTEYIGAEQYGEFCKALPAPAAAKVGTSTTSRGGRVTGTEVGRSDKVTGDETGTCKRVTGTEYLAAEQAGEFCGTTLEPRPEKVGFGMTARKNPISGSDFARPITVTGGEPGATRAITGSAYTDPAGIGSPEKGEARQNDSGKPRGIQTSAGAAPSDARKGVTGSLYMSTEAFLPYSRTEPFQSPAKSGATRVSKDAGAGSEGRPARVTGDDHGASKPVTGTAYIGADQYADFNAGRVAAEALNRARLGRAAELKANRQESGEPHADIVRSEAGTSRATSPSGERTRVGACGRPAMATHYRARSPEASVASAGITGNALGDSGVLQPGDFSVAPPARAAQDSEVRRITGSAFGGNGRITGSLARATGLVSGTPEFRYRDSDVPEWQPAAPASAAGDPPVERITGEGRERNVTGDAWDRGGRVTGTEGRSASGRNPTQRGEPRASSISPRTPREVEPAPLNSRITGSSGNSSGGAVVTLSGGARG